MSNRWFNAGSIGLQAPDNGAGGITLKTTDNGDGTASLCTSCVQQVYTAPLYNYFHTAAATTNTVKSGSGILAKIIINTPITLSTVRVYDGLSAAGALIANISSIIGQTYVYDCAFAIGLTIVASLATDVTVIFQ